MAPNGALFGRQPVVRWLDLDRSALARRSSQGGATSNGRTSRRDVYWRARHADHRSPCRAARRGLTSASPAAVLSDAELVTSGRSQALLGFTSEARRLRFLPSRPIRPQPSPARRVAAAQADDTDGATSGRSRKPTQKARRASKRCKNSEYGPSKYLTTTNFRQSDRPLLVVARTTACCSGFNLCLLGRLRRFGKPSLDSPPASFTGEQPGPWSKTGLQINSHQFK